MKTIPSLLLLLLAMMAPCLLSCSDDDDPVVDEVWKTANEEAFNSLTFDPSYKRLSSPSNYGHIYYKVLRNGTGLKPIYYTSTVTVYYTGSLIDGTVFDKAEYPDKLPFETAVTDVIEGWRTALQYMHEGDRWEIWIPQELGYGTVAKSAIPAYSTLHFEMEVVKIAGIEE
ncbi:MAG: FKBP-type peptidyl-prolyl cis-trans isomerase [Tannerellaceae bacterium]|jgi:peptidylprolyl isomerase/FKBP-type peptidyl-prolyl cis-trans isomerase FklB|nr:FKBP-type peptidyl-prolyl cis-trans isomerase [Tannerellaceae bacterium]